VNTPLARTVVALFGNGAKTQYCFAHSQNRFLAACTTTYTFPSPPPAMEFFRNILNFCINLYPQKPKLIVWIYLQNNLKNSVGVVETFPQLSLTFHQKTIF